LAIADYDEFSFIHRNATGDSLKINNYVWKGQNLQELEKQARQTLPLMDLFSEVYGPYPFARESYGHSQVGYRGGMEHQTISSMNILGYFLVAHELAHQWFGNRVTNKTWNDLWIQEGFATFSEALSLERFLGSNDYESWFKVRRSIITARPDGSVYLPDDVIDQRTISRIFDFRLTYLKAAWVIHMLRNKMGDESFFRGLRAYLDEFAYSAASTDDFKKVMELAHGESLDRFFKDWVYGQGYPMLQIKYRRSTEGNGAVWVEVEQSGSHESVSSFEFPLEIRFKGFNDTLMTLHIDGARQVLLMQPDMEWDTIEVDPNTKLLYSSLIITSDDNGDQSQIPASFKLLAAYPNPFNPRAIIPVQVSESGELIVDILDIQGKLVQRLHRAQVQAGRRDILWEAGSLSSGIYLIRARMGIQTQTLKMTLLR
jgi:aminopeptidase N